ncbi:MAG: ATP-binding protein, partial [Verrucomicrobiota bacterium]
AQTCCALSNRFLITIRPPKSPSRASAEEPDCFPMLRPEGDRHLWLSEIRDYLDAVSVTLTTIHTHALGARDPYSSLESSAEISHLVRKVLKELEIDQVPANPFTRWLTSIENHGPLFIGLIPAPEAGKASLVVTETHTVANGIQLERLNLATTLTAREARLVQETERRVSAEEMFYHSQKLNCMGQLAGGIAHDFNNLLTVIQGHTGFVEMAAESWNDPKAVESIELIQNATSQSVGLVKQLLLFSRDQKASFETVNLNVVVEDFSKMVSRMIEETIELRLELDSEPTYIRADIGMLSQVLMNLIVNARDAMSEGGEVVIRTARRSTSEENQRPLSVALTISDSGCGIPKDKLSKIFDPFYTTKPKGTGLGLANVAGLIRQHSGAIDISSEIGEGTSVEILFPATEATTIEKELSKIPLQLEPAEEQSIDGATVLLVEDESAVRKLVKKLLEMHGCTVIEAASGRKALELWPSINQDLSVVVSDVVMPEGVSGWDLARKIRERRPDLGILLTSGYNEKPEDHGFEGASNFAFLQKPYEANRLKRNISKLITESTES